MKELEDFLPRYLSFIRGVIHSEDLPLNISWEMLQESKMLEMIARKIGRKILQLITEFSAKGKEQEEVEGIVC
jgi:HSP90 family molecular chaperone